MAKLTPTKTKSNAGRPTKYRSEFAEQAYKYCLLGADDKKLAYLFEVDESTINRWKKDHKEFCESIKNGKEIADAEIASSLFHRAKGYSHPEDKIFNNQGVELVVPTIKHYPPDTTAAIFWLKNRQKDNWRDKQEVDTNVNMNINNLTDDELDAKIQALMNGES